MDITNYLKEKNINYQVTSHKPAFTAQHLAAREHVPGIDVAKPVVVQADGTYYMCVLPACCKIDMDKLRGQLNASEIQLASEKEMAKLFPDCELGAEPPFGKMFGMATLMDEHLGKDGFLCFQIGAHDQAVRVKIEDYISLEHPKIMDFTYHLH